MIRPTRGRPPRSASRAAAAVAGAALSAAGVFAVTVPAATAATSDGPHITSVFDNSAPLTGGSFVQLQGHGFVGATAVDFGSVQAATFTVLGDGDINTVAPAASTAGPVEITVTTPSGKSTLNPGDVFTYVDKPLFNGFVQRQSTRVGPSPTPVSFSGYGFYDATALDVAGASVTPDPPKFDNVIYATPPVRSSAGSVPVSVVTKQGSTSSTSLSQPLTYDNQPVVNAVSLVESCGTYSCDSAPEGGLSGGEQFTVQGSGFAGATAVTFGGVSLSASSYSVDGDSTITGTVPAGTSAGPSDVVVTTPGGSSALNPSDIWFYQPGGTVGGGSGTTAVPAVTGLDPSTSYNGTSHVSSGQAGDQLTLSGSGFSGATAVDFGSVKASTFKANSDSSISVTVPSGLPSSSVAITVSNSGGSSTVTPLALFTPTSVPQVSGSIYEGSGVYQVLGSGFEKATSVDFAGTGATKTQVVSDSEVVATAPASASYGDITVTGPGGTSAIEPGDVFGFGTSSVPVVNSSFNGESSSPSGGQTVGGAVYVPSGSPSSFSAYFGSTQAVTNGPPVANTAGCNGDCILGFSATVPAVALAGPVAVTVDDGTASSVVSPQDIWYYGPSGAGAVPVVTGLSASAIEQPGAGEPETVAVYGSGFSGATAVNVGGLTLSGSAFSVFSDDSMTVEIPSTVPTGTEHVTVTTAKGTSAPTTDDLLQVLSPPATAPAAPPGATSSKSATTSSSSTPASASTGAVTATADGGTGGVTVSTYGTDPEQSSPSGATGNYVDVEVSAGETFTTLAIQVCNMNAGQVLEYYNGTSWVTMSPQSFDPGTGCSTVSLNDSNSTPLISALTGTVIAAAIPPAPPVSGGSTTPTSTASLASRIAGTDAEGTAVAALEQQFPTTTCVPSHSVVLATDATYPDALAASYLAGEMGTGVLLTPPGSLSQETAQAIGAEGITRVVVVGGTDAVSAAVVNALQALAATACGGGAGSGNVTVTRLAGPTQYDTAADIATGQPPSSVGQMQVAGAYGSYNDTTGTSSSSGPTAAVPTAVIASGQEYQDATAASSMAYTEHLPVLLTEQASLPTQTATALTQLGIKQALLLGGPAAVSNAVVSSLQGMGISVLRIAGLSYGDTSQQLARFELAPAGQGLAWREAANSSMFDVALARGNGYSDALSSSVVTGPAREPVLLTTDPDTLGTSVTNFFKAAGTQALPWPGQLATIQPFGGTLALSDATLQAALTAAKGG